MDRHIHKMLFGHIAAVLAGVLFDAIPNWKGADIPSFTRNWLTKRARVGTFAPGRMPAPYGRFDAVSFGVTPWQCGCGSPCRIRPLRRWA